MRVKRKLLRLAVALGALATAAACSRGVGDECVTSVDCSPSGDRICDLSQPGGYCTVDGCDARSCPEDSACIRYFPEAYLTKPCLLRCEDVALTQIVDGCPTDPAMVDKCSPDEACMPLGPNVGPAAESEGLCARRAFERRSCARTCGGDGDCRGGYECRPTGTRGSLALTSSPDAVVKFCAPRAP